MLKFLSNLTIFRWDSIIGSSSSTMRMLPLMIRSNWETKQEEIRGLRRKFHSIILDSVQISNKKLSSVMRKIGSHVRCLQLEQVQVDHRSFKDILDALKMLEKLTIFDSDVGINGKKRLPECTLKTLKSFVFIQSDWLFLEFLMNTQVREFKIASHFVDNSNEIFENFMSKQSNLESLAVHVSEGEVFKSLALNEKNKCNFKIKQLYVDYRFWGDDASVDQAFVKFLQQHKSTLENLETQKNLSEELLEYILKNLKIKRLIIEADQLPASPLFYNSIRPNEFLKTLVVKGELKKFDAARGLLHTYPSVEKLIVTSWTNEIINDVLIYIANSLKVLRFLEIPTLSTDTPELPIPSLKTLHVDFVDDVAQWQTICVNNPSIEQVNVKWLTNRNTFTYEVIDAITSRLQNLKHIRFGAYFKPTMRILELMGRNCPNLQMLEVFADSTDEQQNSKNTNLGQFKIIYFPHEAVDSVFKEEPTMWAEEKNFDLESDSGSDFSDEVDNDDLVFDDDDDGSDLGWDDEGDNDFDDMIYYY